MSGEHAFDLRRLVNPHSIAIVGVSPEPGSIGGAVLGNLERFGYGGTIHLVSRNRSEIGGRPCLASIDDLPEGVDTVVLALPSAAIRDAVAACIRRKAGAAIVYASGFAEVGEAGRAAQDEIAKLARDGGLALCGPNGMGFINYADGIPLTYEPIQPRAASANAPAVGVVAQSGAMAAALRFALLGKGLAVSTIVSTGNEAVLGSEDFLEVLVDDGRTRAIAMFAEQIRQPQRFLAVADRARAVGKPIILMHPGRSTRAQESAASHTGALAGNYAIMSIMMRHHGVVLVDTIEELLDATEILARFPKPSGLGGGVVTNSGAFKGFALDFCESVGLDLPRLGPEAEAALRAALPPFATIDNPLDTTGQTIKDASIFTNSARHVLGDPGIGSLVVSLVPGGPKQAMDKADALRPALIGSTKPVAVAVMGDEVPLPDAFISSLRDNGIPFFRSPERAMRAMAHATAYGRMLAAPVRVADVSDALRFDLRVGTLAEYEGKELMAKLGIAVPRGALAREFAEARRIAGEIGYPVVLKAQAAALAHKSEAGGVIVGLQDPEALADGWDRLTRNVATARPDLTLDGVLVERMGEAGVELVVGGRRDPDWGPTVMVGLGGIWIEALNDVRLMPADLGREAVLAEIGRLKGAALLRGLRGRPPADVEAFADIVVKIGALMRANPALVEIDINPLMVYPAGRGAMALDVLLVAAEKAS